MEHFMLGMMKRLGINGDDFAALNMDDSAELLALMSEYVKSTIPIASTACPPPPAPTPNDLREADACLLEFNPKFPNGNSKSV